MPASEKCNQRKMPATSASTEQRFTWMNIIRLPGDKFTAPLVLFCFDFFLSLRRF